MNTSVYEFLGKAYNRELLDARAQFTADQLADADGRRVEDGRSMGSSVALLRQWARETEECRAGGIVDQRMAKIDAKNMSLPEKERSKRSAKLARQKADALKPGEPAGEVLRVNLIHVKKHRSEPTYSVIDGFTHEALDSGIKDRGTAEGVAVMVSADPIFDEVVPDPEECA
jgi:hypothetical protein